MNSHTMWTTTGIFPSGNSSLGNTLLAGHIRVAWPAAAITAVVIFCDWGTRVSIPAQSGFPPAGQKVNRAFNCSLRGGLLVVTWPKFAESTAVPGAAKWTELVILNASAAMAKRML